MGRIGSAVVALGVVAVCLGGLPAAAQQPAATAEELGLEVVVGHGGRSTGGAWVPVEVVLDPARLLEADLVVSTRSLSGAVSQVEEVEAAARSRRVHRFLLPNGPVRVRVEERGREPLEVRGPDAGTARGFTVGYLGDVLPQGLPAVRSGPTGWTATWAAVSPAWLAVSPAALEPLGALVAPVEALAALPAEDLAALRTAVVEGTDLVVLAAVEGPLPDLGLALPATGVVASGVPGGRALEVVAGAWAMDAGAQAVPAEEGTAVASRMPMGRGTVAVLAASPGAAPVGADPGLWAVLAGPAGRATLAAADWSPAAVAFQLQRAFSREGDAAPALPWLALFTAAYVLVVGPVNGLVLGRLGRRELAWATVPVVTLVFTVAAFLGVSAGRPPEGLAARVHLALDGVASELVAAGARAPTEGTRTIALDGAGWAARPLVDGGRPVVLRSGGQGVTAELDLVGLQFGGLVARRSTPAQPPLAIEAVEGAPGLLLRVRNTGDAVVEGVVVRAATVTRAVGALAPGEEREVDVSATALPLVPAYTDPFEGVPSLGASPLQGLLGETLLDGSPGTAWAVGALPAAGVEVRVDGAAAEDRGLLVAVGTSLDDAAHGPFATARDAVAVQGRPARIGPLAFDEAEVALLRFRLPPGAAAGRLRARIETVQPGLRQEAQVWAPGAARWLPLEEAFGPDGGDPAQVLDPLGTAWVRVEGDLYPFDYSGASLDGLAEEAAP